MTLTELEKLEALYAAATPGRWSPAVWQGNDDTGGWAAVGPHQESTDCICEGEEERTACAGEFCADDRSQNDEEQAMEDAKAIAALHNAFPAMAKALREARAEMKERQETLEQAVAERASALAERNWANERYDEARAEVERLLGIVEVNDRRLAAVWDEAHAEVGRLRIENKFLRERPIPEGRIHQAMTGHVMDLRALVLDQEWVTDRRECVVYCLWCKQTESKGHAEACEMFGPGGLIPIDPKTKRPAPVKSLRERGCQCQWEEGDSSCRVHGEVSL